MLVSLLSLARGDVVLSLARPDTRGTEARGDMVWGADGDLDIEKIFDKPPQKYLTLTLTSATWRWRCCHVARTRCHVDCPTDVRTDQRMIPVCCWWEEIQKIFFLLLQETQPWK